MPYQYPTPVGPRASAASPGMPGLGNANRNSIAQALMNVRSPPPQAGGVPGGMMPPGQIPGAFPPIPPGGPGSFPPGGAGTAGPMPTAPMPPAVGPQYGSTGGTAGPMPLAPPQPGAVPPVRPVMPTRPLGR